MLRGFGKPWRARGGWPLACLTLLLGAGGSASALTEATPTRVRVGNSPPVAATARDVGAVAAATRMHVTVVLKIRDAAGLARYAREVSTPGSSLYHVFLTPTQFAQRFGATAGQVAAVEASMRRHGLRPGSVTANRLSIPLSGTASQIERAFSLSFQRQALARGRVAVVADVAPAFDRNVAGYIQGVEGLSSASYPRPLLVRPAGHRASLPRLSPRAIPRAAPGAASACPAAQAAAANQGAYTADELAAAYRFSELYAQGAEGQGQTVAIYELEPFDPNDVAAYQACFGTAASVNNILVDGGAGSGEGSGEAALDIENAIGFAPRANFLIYSGPNANQDTPGSGPYDTFNEIISQDKARVISISWGQCEQLQGSGSISNENTLFQEAAAQGESVVSATGDEGAEDCNGSNGVPDPSQAVDDPGSEPFVTGVGGTTLSALGPPPTESVWNHGGAPTGLLAAQGGAGGGGVSHAWTMPGYQRDAPPSLHVIGPGSDGSACANASGYCREVPDVSADADPATGYIIYWNGSGADPTSPQGWQAVGGTSAAAPVWAALIADADSSTACHGSAIGFANPALYSAASSAYASYFNDVTSGNNDYTGTNGGLYPAGPAYDMASGIGTPKAGALAAALCADSLRVNNPGNQFATVGQNVSLQITSTALPGAKLTFYSSQLPPGLSVSKSTGHVSGKPKRIGTWFSGIAALDQDLALRAAFFTWKVAGAPKISQTSLSGLGSGRPTLAFTISAGTSAPQLESITLSLPRGLSFGRPGRQVTITASGRHRVAFSARLNRGRLVLTLAHASRRIRVSIRSAALRVSGGLAAAARRRRRSPVTISVQTLDAGGHTVGQRTRIRPSS